MGKNGRPDPSAIARCVVFMLGLFSAMHFSY
jgi:hypothetical protein